MSKTAVAFVQKNGLNLAKRWHFTSAIQHTNVIAGLKLFTIGTNVTTVLLAQETKSSLKLVRMETDIATDTYKREHWDNNIVLL